MKIIFKQTDHKIKKVKLIQDPILDEIIKLMRLQYRKEDRCVKPQKN